MNKSAFITIIVVMFIFGGYEWYLRSQRFIISYDDDNGALFSDIRRKVYLPSHEATVMIGSSRIKFDLDIPKWKEKTGETAVQLANVGSSPLLILKDLAEDPQFRGKVVIDVTESTFFDMSGRSNRRPKEKIDYYTSETLAQRGSFFINDVLELYLIFLDKENFSLSALLKKLPLPERPGKKEIKPYPTDFGRVSRERQEIIGINFVEDTSQINQMKNVWTELMMKNEKMSKTPQNQIDSVINLYKTHIKKIQSRQGRVVFVRPPSSGPLYDMEKKFFPREKYWDRLIALTEVTGLHFEDDTYLKKFQCIEYSHLNLLDSKKYTSALVGILRKNDFFQ